MRIYAAYLPHI